MEFFCLYRGRKSAEMDRKAGSRLAWALADVLSFFACPRARSFMIENTAGALKAVHQAYGHYGGV